MFVQVEHYTSPFEVKKVETLVANFGHKAKHQTIDKVPDMIPAFVVLGVTLWYVIAGQILPSESADNYRNVAVVFRTEILIKSCTVLCPIHLE
jgi:hypothetical protein